MKKIIIAAIVFMIVATGCSGTNNSGKNSSKVDYGKEDYKKIIAANNQLGFTLLPEVEADAKGNTFISPTSLFMALSMVYNGADGVTKEEMAKVLQIEGMDVGELNPANASLLEKLEKESKNIELKLANSLWLNETLHFQKEFSQNTTDYFQAKTEEIDINDNKSAEKINNWVKEHTNDTIEKMVEAPLNPDLVAILINAIYFKGNWKNEFDPEQTEERTFYLTDGATKEWPLMTLSEKIAYQENDSFQAVSLPYGENEMSMKIFLPNENMSLAEFKSMLSSSNWEKWKHEFRKREGTLWLPKFQLEYEVTLNDTLKKLGMTSAFTKEADFTKMIDEDYPIWISEVKQKTFIDVNEEGTEASAVTSVEMEKASAPVDGPFYLEVNRPFFFAITDDETDTILFMGLISNPQQRK